MAFRIVPFDFQQNLINRFIEGIPAVSGMIFDVQMSLGKTLIGVEIVKQLVDKNNGLKITCLVPTDAIGKQWKDTWDRQIPPPDNDPANPESKHNTNFQEFKFEILLYSNFNLESFDTKDRILICDEAHNISRMFHDAPEIVEKMAKSTYRLLFTGTIMYDSIENLLYAVNIAAGYQITEQRPYAGWLLPFNEAGLRQSRFYKVNKIKSVLLGYLVTIMTFRVLNTQLGTKILDVADFYADNVPKYKQGKDKIVRSLLKYTPLVDVSKFTKDSPFGGKVSIKNIISIILYYSLSSPFSGFVPFIIASIMLKDAEDLNVMQEEEFFKTISKYVGFAFNIARRPSLKSYIKTQGRNLIVGAVTTKSDLCKQIQEESKIQGDKKTTCKVYDICRVKILYENYQAETFVRFASVRLTPLEQKLLGMSKTESEYLQQQGRANPEDIENYGLQIGNIILKKSEYDKIQKENAYLVEDRMVKGELALPTGQSALVATGLTLDQTEEKFFRNPKFEDVNDKLKGKRRAVIYSRFNQGLENIKRYLVTNHGYEAKYFKNLTLQNSYSTNPIADWYEELWKREKEENPKQKIILLDPELTEGLDRIRNCEVMFILEPLSNYARLTQLRARVLRTGSHDVKKDVQPIQCNPDTHMDPIVTYFEYGCTLKFFEKHFINRFAWKNWWQHNAKVFYLIAATAFSQSSTPDEIVFQKLGRQEKFTDDMHEYFESHCTK